MSKKGLNDEYMYKRMLGHREEDAGYIDNIRKRIFRIKSF